MTPGGQLLLYSLGYGQKRGLMDDLQFEISKNFEERPMCMAVCDKSKYLLIEVANWEFGQSSRNLLFEIRGDRLAQKALIDGRRDHVGVKNLFSCLGYFGDHVLWVGLLGTKSGRVYDYNVESEEFSELEDKRFNYKNFHPKKLCKFNGKFYFNGLLDVFRCLSLSE